MFGRNVACRPITKLSSFRKISLATWRTPEDSSVYGSLEIRARKALELIETIRKQTGVKVTITHLIVKAVAHTLAKHPELNVLIRGKKLYLRDSVDVFLQVFLEEGGRNDLSGAKIENADKKTVVEIAQDLERKATSLRRGEKKELKKTQSLFSHLPVRAIGWLIKISGFLMYDLNWDLSRFGIQKDPFGGVMITNVGMFGLQLGHAPLVPYSRVPMIFAISAIEDKVVFENGEIKVEPVFHIGATADHRIIDGYLAGLAAKTLKTVLEDPQTYLA